MMRQGERRRLLLSNRAITTYERLKRRQKAAWVSPCRRFACRSLTIRPRLLRSSSSVAAVCGRRLIGNKLQNHRP